MNSVKIVHMGNFARKIVKNVLSTFITLIVQKMVLRKENMIVPIWQIFILANILIDTLRK